MSPEKKRRLVVAGAVVVLVGSLGSIGWQLFAPPEKPANPGNVVPSYHYPGGGKPPWMNDPAHRGPTDQVPPRRRP